MSSASEPPPERPAAYYRGAAEWRAWLEANAATASEHWIGFFRRATGEPSISWRDAVDEALCFGWIDGLRQPVDERRYRQRFTPRTRRSTWSAVNIARVGELAAQGRMRPAGLEAFARRTPERSGLYAHEQRGEIALAPAQEAAFRAQPAAWEWFAAQAPSFRRQALWWVVSARREETRVRRLGLLIAAAAEGRRPDHLRRAGERG